MKRLLTILLLIISANVFGQIMPAPSGTLTPLTTNQAYFRASDSTYYFYNGTNYLWNYFLNKKQADKLYQPLGSPTPVPFSLSSGYGLVGSSFDGSVARTWTADTASAGGLVSKSRLATNLGGYVPSSRTITINGATRDLSTNRTWNVGTVISVGSGYGLLGGAITSSGVLSVDTLVLDTVYAKIDSLGVYVKKTGDTMTGTLNGTDIVLSDNLQADTVKGTAAIFNSSSKTLQVQFSGANVLSVNSTLAGASAPGGVYVNTLISGATQLSNLTVTNLNAGGLIKAVSPSGLVGIAISGTDYLAPGTAVLLTGNQSIAGNKTFTDDVNITGTDGTPSLTVTASGSVSRAISASTSGSSSIAIIADGTSGASGVVASAGNGAYGVQGNNTGSGWGGGFTSVSGPAIAAVSTSGVGGTFQSGSANIAEFYGSGATLKATVAQSGSISSTPQGTLYGTASGSITSAQLATSLTNETGTGSAVFSASPTFTGTVAMAALTGTSATFSGDINSNTKLQLGAWDVLKWTGSVLKLGGITGSQWTQVETYTNGTVRYTIDASGNNTWTGSGTFANTITSGNGTVNAILSYTSLAGLIGTSTNHPLNVVINNNERARFTSGGFFKASNDGTYVNSAGVYHELRSSQPDWTVYATNTNASSPNGIVIAYPNAAPNGVSNHFFYASDNAAVRFYVKSDGGIGNFSANNVNLSDERVKKNIVKAGSYWEIIKAIEFDKFQYKKQNAEDKRKLLGVMAQQVESVYPDWVSNSGSFGKTSDGSNLKSVYEQQLQYGVNIVVQESQKRIEALEAEVKLLKSK